MVNVHNVKVVACGPFAVTNPDATGLKITLMRFRYAAEIVALRHTARTAVGTGTITFTFLVGAATVANQGTGTGLSANTWTSLTETEFTRAVDDSLDVLIKGDGTLDLADYMVQVEYVDGSPAAALA